MIQIAAESLSKHLELDVHSFTLECLEHLEHSSYDDRNAPWRNEDGL